MAEDLDEDEIDENSLVYRVNRYNFESIRPNKFDFKKSKGKLSTELHKSEIVSTVHKACLSERPKVDLEVELAQIETLNKLVKDTKKIVQAQGEKIAEIDKLKQGFYTRME
jgi:hypothetical protein